jgi:hypothetical protein
MVAHSSLLVSLIALIDAMPQPRCGSPNSHPSRRGRPHVYDDRLFLKALVIMIVRHLTTVHELWNVLQQPGPEMRQLRQLLCPDGRFPCRRTWERRLKQLPGTLPARIGCLGRYLVELLLPFAHTARAAAIDSTLLPACNGRVWHKKQREQGVIPHSGIDPEAGWTKSGHHGWVYGWKLHVSATAGEIWIPLAAELTPANTADNEVAPRLIPEISLQVRYLLGDTHYNAPNVRRECDLRNLILIASQHGTYPHPEDAHCSKEVRRLLHKVRSITIENFNEHFKSLFQVHGPVPTKGHNNTARWVLGEVLTYQLLLWHCWQQNLPLRQGLKYILKAA